MFETWAHSRKGFYDPVQKTYNIDIKRLINLVNTTILTQKIRPFSDN